MHKIILVKQHLLNYLQNIIFCLISVSTIVYNIAMVAGVTLFNHCDITSEFVIPWFHCDVINLTHSLTNRQASFHSSHLPAANEVLTKHKRSSKLTWIQCMKYTENGTDQKKRCLLYKWEMFYCQNIFQKTRNTLADKYMLVSSKLLQNVNAYPDCHTNWMTFSHFYVTIFLYSLHK